MRRILVLILFAAAATAFAQKNQTDWPSAGPDLGGTRYSRSGYNGNNRFWQPDTQMPCNQPPWGRIFAIKVITGDIAWESVLGATDDSRFHTFDSETGKKLWGSKIDAGAHTAPITYQGKDGKQFAVITATGGGFLGDRSHSASVIAFALPKD